MIDPKITDDEARAIARYFGSKIPDKMAGGVVAAILTRRLLGCTESQVQGVVEGLLAELREEMAADDPPIDVRNCRLDEDECARRCTTKPGGCDTFGEGLASDGMGTRLAGRRFEAGAVQLDLQPVELDDGRYPGRDDPGA